MALRIVFLLCVVAIMGCYRDATATSGLSQTDRDQREVCTNAFSKKQQVTDVKAGFFYSCDLREGQVNCWGKIEPTPKMKNVVQLATNEQNACAIDQSGIHCWGCNYWYGGGCEAGSTMDPPEMKWPTEIAMGPFHACAIDEGKVKCWSVGYAPSLKQTQVPENLKNPRHLSAGSDFTCVQTDEGVRCWGLGAWCGQSEGEVHCNEERRVSFNSFVSSIQNNETIVIDGRNICALSPRGIRCLDKIELFEQMATASNFVVPGSGKYGPYCVQTLAGLRCWESANPPALEIPTPTDALFPSSVSTGGEHICAISDQGEAICWGTNPAGHGPVSSPVTERPCDYMKHQPLPQPVPSPDPEQGRSCSPRVSDSFCTDYSVGGACDTPDGSGVCVNNHLSWPGENPGCTCFLPTED